MTDLRPSATMLSGYDPEIGLLLTVVLSTEGVVALLNGGAVGIALSEHGLPRGAIVLAAGADVPARAQVLMGGEARAVALDCAAGDAGLGKTAYRCPREGCGFQLHAIPTGEMAGAFAIVHGPAGATFAQCPNDGAVLEPAA